jgi:putative SOS response-associated peptidase YedK
MCGRYRRRADKQRIAELFAASADLEELYIGPEDDVAPGSVQPVIRINSRGERKISLMRWGFKREDGKLLFNARAESITDVNFWMKSFSLRRSIVPPDGFFEWVRPASRPDDCPAWSRDRTCRPIGSTLAS